MPVAGFTGVIEAQVLVCLIVLVSGGGSIYNFHLLLSTITGVCVYWPLSFVLPFYMLLFAAASSTIILNVTYIVV